MTRIILLAGPSASGKTTLARAIIGCGAGVVVSSSSFLRRSAPSATTPEELFKAGQLLDNQNPDWLYNLVMSHDSPLVDVIVVDAVRSDAQWRSFADRWSIGNIPELISVNVLADGATLDSRRRSRSEDRTLGATWMFSNPSMVWRSDMVSVQTMTSVLRQCLGVGYVDVIIGGQYGSEGKGKLAALLAPNYDVLVRSGGPNAGHWVRDESYEFCFHHLPSGSIANRKAQIYIAAGATINPEAFLSEVDQVGCEFVVDENTVLITKDDREHEVTEGMVEAIGSTAQGVGSATARRIMRGADVRLASQDPRFEGRCRKVSSIVALAVDEGKRVCLEGTQGSGLSLYHGPYPYCTSRDTNVSGLLAEVGCAPSVVRDTWMVVRSYPIRVAGNSGPMYKELTWEAMAIRLVLDPEPMKIRELTSTTKRQRRVGQFDWDQFEQAVRVNRPTKLFLTFADYIDRAAEGITEFTKLPESVRHFIGDLERRGRAPVMGVSTGPRQVDVCWR